MEDKEIREIREQYFDSEDESVDRMTSEANNHSMSQLRLPAPQKAIKSGFSSHNGSFQPRTTGAQSYAKLPRRHQRELNQATDEVLLAQESEPSMNAHSIIGNVTISSGVAHLPQQLLKNPSPRQLSLRSHGQEIRSAKKDISERSQNASKEKTLLKESHTTDGLKSLQTANQVLKGKNSSLERQTQSRVSSAEDISLNSSINSQFPSGHAFAAKDSRNQSVPTQKEILRGKLYKAYALDQEEEQQRKKFKKRAHQSDLVNLAQRNEDLRRHAMQIIERNQQRKKKRLDQVGLKVNTTAARTQQMGTKKTTGQDYSQEFERQREDQANVSIAIRDENDTYDGNQTLISAVTKLDLKSSIKTRVEPQNGSQAFDLMSQGNKMSAHFVTADARHEQSFDHLEALSIHEINPKSYLKSPISSLDSPKNLKLPLERFKFLSNNASKNQSKIQSLRESTKSMQDKNIMQNGSESASGSGLSDEMNTDEERELQNKMTSNLNRRKSVVLQQNQIQKLSVTKRHLHVSQVSKEATALTQEEIMKNSASLLQKMTLSSKSRFEGRELPFLTGFHFCQCVANPNMEDSFITVMPIDFHKRAKKSELLRRTKTVASNDSVFAAHPSELEPAEQKDRARFLYSCLQSIEDEHVQASNPKPGSVVQQKEMAEAQESGFFIEHAKVVPSVCPAFDLNVEDGQDYADISLWFKRAPTARDSRGHQGFHSVKILSAANLLAKPINSAKGLSQALFVSPTTNVVFFFSENLKKVLYLNLIKSESVLEAVGKSDTNTTPKKSMPTLLEKHIVEKFRIPQHSILEQQVRYFISDHYTTDWDRQLPNPTLVELEGQTFLVFACVTPNEGPKLSFFRLQNGDPRGGDSSPDICVGQARTLVAEGEPFYNVEGAELLLGMQADTIFFLTNRALTSGRVTDQGLARLQSPSLVKALPFDTLLRASSLSSLAEKLAVNAQLQTWELEGSVEAMTTLRSQTVGEYPFVEAFLAKTMSELTLSFSGSQKKPGVALTFCLRPEAKRVSVEDSVFIGQYKGGDEQTYEISLAVPHSTDVPIKGLEIRGTKKRRPFTVKKHDLDQSWTQVTTLGDTPVFDIDELQIEPKGRFVRGHGTLSSLATAIKFKPLVKSKATADASEIYFPGETPFDIELVSATKKIKARFEGFFSESQLSTQLIGVFTDETDPRDVVKRKVTFRKMTTSELKFVFKSPETEQEPDEQSFGVKIVSGQILSAKEGSLKLVADTRLSNSIIEHVHKVSQNAAGIHVLSGSIRKLLNELSQSSNDEEVNLSLTTVSQDPKHVTIGQAKTLQVPARSILDLLNHGDALKDELGLVQELTVSLDYVVTVAMTCKTYAETNASVKFITKKLQTTPRGDDKEAKIEIDADLRTSMPQSVAMDYPLVVYKNYNSENNELVIGNFARSEMLQMILNLGEWSFLSFVGFPKQRRSKLMRDSSAHQSQVFVLVRHQLTAKVHILMLQADPWQSFDSNKFQMIAFQLATQDIRLPGALVFEELKRAECLIQENVDEQHNVVLLLQSERELWAVPLILDLKFSERPVSSAQAHVCQLVIGDSTECQMVKRVMLRSHLDPSLVVCAVTTNNTQKLITIELEPDQAGLVTIKDFFSLQSGSKIAGMAIDIENQSHLYLVDDLQNVFHIPLQNQNRIVTDNKQTLSAHSLEEELEDKARQPWSNLIITDRLIKVSNYYFSMNTTFFWKVHRQANANLVSEHMLSEALYILQVWQTDTPDAYTFRCKPIPSFPVTDLVGQIRAKENPKMYFLAEDLVMVCFVGLKPLFFNSQGVIVEMQHLRNPRTLHVLACSMLSSDEGRYFLLQDASERNFLYASFNGVASKIMHAFTFPELHRLITSKKFQPSLATAKGQPFDELNERELRSSLLIHSQLTMVSKSGTIIIIASAVLDSHLLDASMTIVSQQDRQGERKDSGTDDHSKYDQATRFFGFFHFKSVLVVLFLCKSREQQVQFGIPSGVSHLVNSRRNAPQNDNGLKRSKTERTLVQRNFKFTVIKNRLIWLSFDLREVWFVDLQDQVALNSDEIQWVSLPCKGFTVKEVTEGLSIEDLDKKGVYLSEPRQRSHLYRHASTQAREDKPICLLQLTVLNNAIVYDLQAENRIEVAQLDTIDDWRDPIKFSMTGFDYKTKQRSFFVNSEGSLGFEQSLKSEGLHGLVNPYSEIDYRQVKSLTEKLVSNQSVSKFEIQEIEPESTTCLYEDQTFFSLFSGQDVVYEIVVDQVQDLGSSKDRQLLRDDLRGGVFQHKRELTQALKKPTTVCVLEGEDLLELPILKQCLLFTDRKATVLIYKLARLIQEINFEDFISCQEDLELIIQRLPAQHYLSILEKFGQNFRTKSISDAIVDRKKQNETSTFVLQSSVISQHTPQLGLRRVQTDEEVRKKVLVKVLPLNWIHVGETKGSNADLFNIFRNNMEILNSSLLLEVIFKSFWPEQQRLILRNCFYPWLVYFSVAELYLHEVFKHNILNASEENRLFKCGLFWGGTMSCETFHRVEIALRYIWMVLCLHQLFVKIYQVKFSKSRLTSAINILGVCLNLFLIASVTLTKSDPELGISMYSLRLVSSIASVWLWVQMFFWLRLFDRTARYVDLIIDTVFDIAMFSLILLLLLVMFATGSYQLQLNRMEFGGDESQYLFPFRAEEGLNLLVEALLNQYKTLLGEFQDMQVRRNYEGFTGQMVSIVTVENTLSLIYFLGTTFFTQITILNMLIAIMSNTFARQTTNLSQLGKKQKLQLMAEYLNIVRLYERYLYSWLIKSQDKKPQTFLFVVFPVEIEEDDSEAKNETERQINQLKRAIDARFKSLETLINRQMVKDLQTLSKDTQTRLVAMEQDQRARDIELSASIKELQRRQIQREEEAKEEREAAQQLTNEEISKMSRQVLHELSKIKTLCQVRAFGNFQ